MQLMRALPSLLLGVLAFLVGAELVFRVLPVATATQTDYHVDPLIRSYPPLHRWTAATGWDLRNVQRHEANNAGFLSRHAFVPDADAVGLVGDSYVEASMLPAPERLDALLEAALPADRKVYALGSPGTSLLDYAERVRWAAQTYGLRDFVLLIEAGDVLQSLCGSGNNDGPCLDRQTLEPSIYRHPQASALKEVARHSALAQYGFSQLKVSPQRLWRQAAQQAQPAQGHDVGKPKARPEATPPVADLRLVDAVARQFVQRVQPHLKGRLVVLLDADRIGSGRAAAERLHLARRLREAGFLVIDAEPIFAAHRNRSALGIEVGPYDRHLNAIGLALLAAPAAQALR
jgi:hypothetical protein